MTKRKNNGPLLFISQPNLKQFPIKTQATFIIKKEDEENLVAEQETMESEEVQVEKLEVDSEEEVYDYVREVVKEIENIEEIKETTEVTNSEVNNKEEVDNYVREVVKEVEDPKEAKEVLEVTNGEVKKTEEVLAPSDSKTVEQINVRPSRKAFREMTNEEKIYFILERPKYIPQVRCRVKAKSEDYIGYVMDFVEKTLHFKIATRLAPVYLGIDDVISIEMIW